MKKLELNQMEFVEGGGRPSNQQVTCYLVGVYAGLFNPIGGIVIGAICLFAD